MTEIYEAGIQITTKGFTPMVLKNGEVFLVYPTTMMDCAFAIKFSEQAAKLLNNPDTDATELSLVFRKV